LSGALYPTAKLPFALKTAALLNPFTYSVDLLKHAMLANPASGTTSELHAGVDVLVSAAFTLLAVLVASWRFSREQAHEPFIHTLLGKRGG